MTDGMSLGRQQAGQLAGTLTGPPERGHRIAPSIRVNQSFQRLDQLGVVLDQSLPSGSGVPYSLNGERWFSKALDSSIDGRTRESGNTGDAGNTSSSQLLCIDGSDKVLLPLSQVRKQQAVFLLEFFCCAHTDSVTHRASFVTIIILRALSPVTCCFRRFMMRSPKERFGNTSVGKTQPEVNVERPVPAGCRTLHSTAALGVIEMVAGAH